MDERRMTLDEASAWLGEVLGVRRSPMTLWRWLYYGCRGVKLGASWCGRWYTTAGALRRFIQASTRQHSAETGCGAEELRA